MRLAPLALLAGLGASLLAYGDQPAGEGRGAAIYQRGEGAAAAEALIGEPPTRVPLTLFPCRGCHGDDGRGIREGGVTAPEIRWSYLTKPYSVSSGPFRRRPPYDEKLFARALREGKDSAGQKLGAAMPRYLLDDRELAGLIAYLRRLDQADQAGSEAIPVGVRLPAGRPGEVMRLVLEAYAAQINQPLPPTGSAGVPPALRAQSQQGGIFERRIELHFLENSEPFATSLTAGLDLSIPQPGESPAAPADPIPVVALFPNGPSDGSKRFTLYSGPQDRAAALAQFARRTLGFEAAAIATLGEGAVPPAGSAIQALLYPGRDPAALRDALAGLPADVILLLPGWPLSPQLMDLARQHGGPVYVAMPPTPHLLGKSGRDLLTRLAATQALPADQRMVQPWALAAARALTAALEKAGRDFRPQSLPGVFENLSKIETGFGPDLRFSPTRRLGARGAVVLRLGRGEEPIAAWHWVALD